MKCPNCHVGRLEVLDSRNSAKDWPIRRRRGCKRCGKRLSTIEIPTNMPAPDMAVMLLTTATRLHMLAEELQALGELQRVGEPGASYRDPTNPSDPNKKRRKK